MVDGTMLAWAKSLPQAMWELGPKAPALVSLALDALHAVCRRSAGTSALLGAMEPALVASFAILQSTNTGAESRLVCGPICSQPELVQVRLTSQVLVLFRVVVAAHQCCDGARMTGSRARCGKGWRRGPPSCLSTKRQSELCIEPAVRAYYNCAQLVCLAG